MFDDQFGELYHIEVGCSGKPTRLMAGLLYLKHIHKLSDEQLVRGWLENPYWQYFCGESHFQTDWPIDPSSLTRYRQRIGEHSCEWLLQQTIAVGITGGAVRQSNLKRVTVDTTVQEKAVSFPTDGWLGRNHLKGVEGDGMNGLLSCAGHNLRLILRRLRNSCARIFVARFFTGLFA